MGLYRNRIYPYLVNTFGNPLPIKKIRQQIIPDAEGNVLEIGAGSGADFPYYNSAKVSQLYALEPNPGMVKLAKLQVQKTKLKVEFIDLAGEQIPLRDRTIDTVVSAFTLCTIPKVEDALKEIYRVLKPGGKLIFFELGLSPDLQIKRWQKRFEPIAHWAYEGLFLTRDIPSLITQGGFHILQMEAGYISQFPKSWTYCFWGNASV